MFLHKTRAVVMASGMAAMMFGAPSESQALFHHLFGSCCGHSWFGHGQATTFRPLYQAPACNPCQTQSVQYVPQTCYRNVTVNVPVTTYQPVTTCDPCTGCPVTVMRPVTTCVQQCRRVPYTSYRQVVTPTTGLFGCFGGGCGTSACAPTVGYAPTASYAAPASPSCCTPTAPAVMAPAPIVTPPPVYSQPIPQTGTPQPSLQPAPDEGAEPRTFQRPTTEAAPYLPPIPQTSSGSSQSKLFSVPQFHNPNDRTTQNAAPQWTVSRAIYIQPDAQPTQEELDADGWRAAGQR